MVRPQSQGKLLQRKLGKPKLVPHLGILEHVDPHLHRLEGLVLKGPGLLRERSRLRSAFHSDLVLVQHDSNLR